MDSKRLASAKSKPVANAFPLHALTITAYSSRFMHAEGAVRIGRRTLRIGTLLNRRVWLKEFRAFLSEIPSAHAAWNREIAAGRGPRPR